MSAAAPRKPLKPLDQALAELLAQATPLAGVDTVSLFDANGRVLAHSAVSPLQVPPQDNSAMDGYALRCADVAQPGAVLPVSQRIPAGSVGTPLQAGTAARIFTGAPIPAGADTVLMREFEQPTELSVHHLLAELYQGVDWVLVDGFKECDLPKIEIWRGPTADYAARPAGYPGDDFIVAIATDAPAQLPTPTQLPLLDLNAPAAIADWLLAQGGRFAYDWQLHGETLT